ncbi:MAG: transcription antitermination protein NusB [Alphaproteobacteria bacterium]
MTKASESEYSGKPSRKAKVLAARLMAVQATYQIMQNKKPVDVVIDEYLRHRTGMEIDGEEMVQPDGALFTKIMQGLAERSADIAAVLSHNLINKNRNLDNLLQAILLCAGWELLAHPEVDAPVIINDYLNVAHSFFDAGEVSLLNGILNATSRAFRA